MLATVYRLYRDARDVAEAIYYTAFVKAQVKSYGPNLQVNGPTNLNRNTVLGRDVHFNGLTVNGEGPVRIGDHFHSGQECMIHTQKHDYEGGSQLPYADGYVHEPVHIEDNVWLGHRVVILPGVTIGEGAIIQMGSVVVRDVPKCAIVGGHPATQFDERDVERYDELRKRQLEREE
jgi:acetyltransferase-like isoleucine patch superfamily enzyme